MKPARSVQETACLPSFALTACAVAATSAAVETVETTSTSFMTVAGLKKCMPDDVGGAAAGLRALDDRQAGRRGGEHRARLGDPAQVGEERLLDRQRLDDGLDDQVDVGQVGPDGAAGDPAEHLVPPAAPAGRG